MEATDTELAMNVLGGKQLMLGLSATLSYGWTGCRLRGVLGQGGGFECSPTLVLGCSCSARWCERTSMALSTDRPAAMPTAVHLLFPTTYSARTFSVKEKEPLLKTASVKHCMTVKAFKGKGHRRAGARFTGELLVGAA